MRNKSVNTKAVMAIMDILDEYCTTHRDVQETIEEVKKIVWKSPWKEQVKK
ncbi:hypothetical protein LC087_19270 (plasmid) [Bacillus carboniphilus]|uniref:Uncharacterized protein n=1 Tax=Bacillus carboniphilus TaxID=86663 RepID=A0ABY9JYP7_9BACI|nr:hypothetical protein [Bacillus carboniphilus]WLR44509.1 hypothetical protein LC087_19270 [Bacillus carboniphilus]